MIGLRILSLFVVHSLSPGLWLCWGILDPGRLARGYALEAVGAR